MGNPDQKDHNYGKDEVPSSLDQALLDEFLSTIASIAVRLTKTDVRDKNGDDSIKREVNEQ